MYTPLRGAVIRSNQVHDELLKRGCVMISFRVLKSIEFYPAVLCDRTL